MSSASSTGGSNVVYANVEKMKLYAYLSAYSSGLLCRCRLARTANFRLPHKRSMTRNWYSVMAAKSTSALLV